MDSIKIGRQIFPILIWFVLILWTGSALANNLYVKVGLGQNPPLTIRNKNSIPTGLAIDVIQDVAKIEGWQIEFVEDGWSNLLEKLDAGDIDILTGIAHSKKRAKRFDFSSEAIVGNWGIVYRRPSIKVNSILDLSGLRIAMGPNGAHAIALVKLLKDFGVTYSVVETKSYIDVLDRVEKGEADVGVVSRLFGVIQINDRKIMATGINFNPVGILFATPKGKNAELLRKIDAYLINGKKDSTSTYQKHLDRWLHVSTKRELPPWITWGGFGALLGLTVTLLIVGLLRRRVIAQTRELKTSETRFKKMIEKLPLPIVITDENQDISFFNDKFTELFGYTLDDVSTAEKWWEIAYPDEEYRAKVQRSWEVSIEKAVANNTDIEMQEWDLTIKNRTKRRCEFYMVPLGDVSLIVLHDITERNRGKERYKKTIELSFDGFWIINKEGHFLDVNEAYCHMIGYKKSELLSMAIPDVDAGMSLEEIKDKIKTIMFIGSGRFETKQRHKNGHIIDVEISTSYIREKEGQFFVFLRDITERKRKERVQNSQLTLVEYASSHSSTELLTKFLDEAEMLTNSRIGFYHFYDDIRKMLSLQTWSTNTIKNMCTAEGSKGHYPIAKAGVWADCARDRKPVIHNNYASLPNKKGLPEGHAPIIRELVVPVIRDGDVIAVLGVGNKESDYNENDVSTIQELADHAWETVSRKLTEELLHENEKKYRRLSENSPAVVYQFKMTLDGTFSFPYINDSVKSVMDVAAENIMQDPSEFLAMVHPEDQEMFLEGVMKSAKSLGLYHAIIRYLKDGKERWLEARSTPDTMEDGSVIWDGFLIDITDKKKAEKERDVLESRLQQSQKMESIGTLAGGIAHDFNNLLYPIIGFSEMLKEDLPPDSPEHESAQEIFNAGKRGSELVKQILAFSRQTEHKLSPVRFQKILTEVCKLTRSTILSDIEIHQDIKKDCGLVMAEATQLHQIAMNLITNAYHAVEKASGKISIQLKEIILDNDDLKNSLLQPGQYVMLSVSDNGVGIPKEIMNNIFEPYFTTKEKGKGTGLGLAVVYGILTEHKGDIKVYSEVGKGTTFNVYLPLMKKSDETISTEKVLDKLTGTERILLVDDEESVVRLEKQMLERLGYKVSARSNSLEALETFNSNPEGYDLVISDMTMPNLTGDQLAQKLMSIRSDIPIIICTGFSERINKKQAEANKVKGFLMKPVVKSEMAQMVRKVLDEAKVS